MEHLTEATKAFLTDTWEVHWTAQQTGRDLHINIFPESRQNTVFTNVGQNRQTCLQPPAAIYKAFLEICEVHIV
ncbi:hypothetical protein E2C01_035904 [Portunus trituberculatus]|uniref:Uncharacterized protein n=1 Tax=Portunus trituberculatus TaxID=210409 RepID=A0A5B7F9M3_PORTR|nr:hypothetical protein [Portunus trituberculatus]